MSDSAPLRPSFATVLDDLWRQKHTGPITIHFAQGVPNVVEIPEAPMRIALDKGREEAHSLTGLVGSRL